MDDLSIIVVTWNSASCILDCLDSVGKAGFGGKMSVVVVDNGSTDETVPLVSRKPGSVTLIRNSSNTGFAAANNQAMRNPDSRYFMLLNPDTVVRPGAFDALVRYMDGHPDVWAVGPSILNADGSPQRTGVTFPTNWNLLVETLFLDRLLPRSRVFGRHRRLYEEGSEPREVDFVQGAALLLRSDVLRRVGGLDEQFFMYFEETDWCFRIRKAGGKIVICPAAEIVHLGGNEFGHFDERRLVSYFSSLLLFYRKHYGFFRRMILRPLIIIRSLLRIAAWSTIAIVRPDHRTRAWSIIRGYSRVILIGFGRRAR